VVELVEPDVRYEASYRAAMREYAAEGRGDEGEALEVRTELTDALRRYGGHVGYAIRPSARRQGHGTTALRLALERCRAIGLARVLVTCDETNAASRRIIEANGGVLEDLVVLQGRPARTMRYWIDVARDG